MSISPDSSLTIILGGIREVASYPGLGIWERWQDPVTQKKLEVRMGGGDMTTWAAIRFLTPSSGTISTPDQKDSVDPRAWSPVIKKDMCPFPGGQGRPRRQALCLLCPGTMEGGGGGVCLQFEKSTDEKYKLWMDWTFRKEKLLLSLSHLSGNAFFSFELHHLEWDSRTRWRQLQ